jgi:glutamate formiminotransferase
MTLLESVPNVSEGRRADVVGGLAETLRATPGVRLLDHSADASHNRSVFTFAGTPPALEEGVLALVDQAIRVIDMRAHRGQHPRIGAVDVVPFVPIADAAMAECVTLARRVGALLAERFELPVYLYEEAATTPERRALENIRRGGFEALGARMATAGWRPDFGPARPHPTAGACAVGARLPLIAFNVNLATDQLEVAQAIARRIRTSSGGLPNVKALGLWIEERGAAQVSINLTDYRRTSIRTVYDAVAREAARRGVSIAESELIGLAPAAALDAATAGHVGLRDFSPARLLEHQLGL